VAAGEQRRFVIREREEKDAQKTREKGGQTRVIDQVEEADLTPRLGSTG